MLTALKLHISKHDNWHPVFSFMFMVAKVRLGIRGRHNILLSVTVCSSLVITLFLTKHLHQNYGSFNGVTFLALHYSLYMIVFRTWRSTYF